MRMYLLVLIHRVYVWMMGRGKSTSINCSNEWVVTSGHHRMIRGRHGVLLSIMVMHHHVRRNRLLWSLWIERICLSVRCMEYLLLLLILLLR